MALRIEDEHEWREDYEVFDRIGMSEVEPLRPGRLRFVIT
jgi:hypothetical protein